MNREDFPILKNCVYLDNAATTQKPKQVIERINKYYEEENANVHRGVYPLSEQATKKYDEVREKIARFINVKTKTIVFTKNATESLNTVAYGLSSLTKKKKIVLTVLNHHANIVPWQQLAKREDFTIEYIKLNEDLTLDMKDAEKKITPDTAVVAFPHIANANGTVIDVEKLIALARKNKALTVVDAVQSVPHRPVDATEMGCDFLAFSGHKMCGPTGIGVLHGKEDLLEKLPPMTTGGDMISLVTRRDAEWNDIPYKFEAGTPNMAGAIGLGEAVTYLESIGMEKIAKHGKTLRTYALQKLNAMSSITLYSPPKGACILSFTVENAHPHDVSALLGEQGVCVRGGHHCSMVLMDYLHLPGVSRVSFYFYNTKEDVDKFIIGLKKVVEVFE